MTRTFQPAHLEAEAGETLGSRPILSTYQFPVQSDYIVKPCL